jgi:rSAM/selenodomain-associated transferase 2
LQRVLTHELSIIVPVYQDDAALNRLLPALSDSGVDIVIAYAGDRPVLSDAAGTPRLVACARPSRGEQLAAGAEAARGAWLWFLHADTQLPGNALAQLESLHGPGWGRFNVRIDAPGRSLRLVSAMMNLRARMTSICTGDQGIVVHRDLLSQIGGFPPQALMEDIELSKRLRRLTSPQVLAGPLRTSARRWQRRGIWRTVFAMWQFRLKYYLGTPAEVLAQRYYGNPAAAPRSAEQLPR